MVRRWSYINKKASFFSESIVGLNFYFKKTFKNTVRFKKFPKKLTKLTRRGYNFRKIVNSSFNFNIYIYKFSKVYKVILKRSNLYQSKQQFFTNKLLGVSSIQQHYMSTFSEYKNCVNFTIAKSFSMHSTKLLALSPSWVLPHLSSTTQTAVNISNQFKVVEFTNLMRFVYTIRKLLILAAIKSVL